MLTPLLLLATTLCPIQDAERPAPAGPATDAAVAPAEAAPAQTSASVSKFLLEAEGLLYDPEKAGLRSLSFDVPMEVPQLGHIGQIHLSWTSGGETTMKVEKAEGVSLPPQLTEGMLDALGKQSAGEFLSTVLNQPISPLLEGAVATMEAPEEGMVKVRITNEAAAAQGLKEQALLFDDDGLLQAQNLVIAMPTPIGAKDVPVRQVYKWKPASEGSDLMLLDEQSTVADLGIMKQKSVVTFTRRIVDDLILTTAIVTTVEGPPPMGGTKTTVAKNLVVNGKPVPDEPAGAVPAEPAPSSGG